jgi:hypothetical protein
MRFARESEVPPTRHQKFSIFKSVSEFFRLVWAVAAEMAVPGISLPTVMEMMALDDRRGEP